MREVTIFQVGSYHGFIQCHKNVFCQHNWNCATLVLSADLLFCYMVNFCIRKNDQGMSKSFSEGSNHFDFLVFLVIEGANYRVHIYPEITMDVNKGQWIKPGICVMVARRNALILFMELKNISAVAVLTGIVKRTVRMKGMFGYNSASKTSSVVVIVLGGFCSPDQRAFQPLQSMSNASLLMSGSIIMGI